MLGVMLAATLCGWAIQDRTVTLQYSSSRGIRPLWARGTGKCYPKQLSTPASCGLSNRGERGRARANLGTLQGGAPLGREGGTKLAHRILRVRRRICAKPQPCVENRNLPTDPRRDRRQLTNTTHPASWSLPQAFIQLEITGAWTGKPAVVLPRAGPSRDGRRSSAS